MASNFIWTVYNSQMFTFSYRQSLEEQKQLVAQLEQERFTANKRAQHLESELNDKKKVKFKSFRIHLLMYFNLPRFVSDLCK